MKLPVLKLFYKILIGFILLVFIFLFAAPRIARQYIVNNSYELTGRRLEIDKVRLNYFTGSLTIRKLRIYEHDSTTTFLSFNRFYINISYWPLLKNELQVTEVALDGLYAQVLQKGNFFNFDDFIKADTSATEEKDSIPQRPLKFTINNIHISNSNLSYTDLLIDHTVALDKIDLIIPGFSWNSETTNLAVDFRFVDGGTLYSKLNINQADSTYSLQLKLDSLNLAIVEPYIKNSMWVSGMKGYLTNDITIKGSMQHLMDFNIKGKNRINNFQLNDTLNQNILAFNSLVVDFDSLSPSQNKFKLNKIQLDRPYLLFELIDTTNNWMALLKPFENTQIDTIKTDSSSQDEIPFDFTLNELSVKEGTVQFNDKTLRYAFAYQFNNLTIDSKNVSNFSDNIEFNISTILNRTGSLRIKTFVDMKNPENIDLDLSIDKLKMTDLTPYFQHYFGYTVTAGSTFFSTNDQMTNNTLISKNKITMKNFVLADGNKNDAKFKIPLRLALGILSNNQGIISLDIPVESKGEDTKIGNLGKLIFKALGNIFLKAATSPYNMLADMYKLDPEKLKVIQFDMFEPQPDKDNLSTLNIIAQILTQKPGIGIEFEYMSDKKKAGDSLAYVMTVNNFKATENFAGLQRGINDSILMQFLFDKTNFSGDTNNISINSLCHTFIGDNNINKQIDSIASLQQNFLYNYLIVDKGLDNKRIKFNSLSKSIDSSIFVDKATFKVVFNANNPEIADGDTISH
jgi:hypothetical protein